MRRIIAGMLIVITILMLAGCGREAEVTTNTVIVEKKGKVTGAIVEDFAQDYYNSDELKQMVEEEVTSYNESSGGEDVSLNRFEVKDGIAKVYLDYDSADTYTAFNGKTLFTGTVAETYDAGYDLDIKMTDANDSTVTIGKDDILGMGDNHIVITEEPVNVRTYGKILYISDGVSLVDYKEATVSEDAGTAVIIFK